MTFYLAFCDLTLEIGTLTFAKSRYLQTGKTWARLAFHRRIRRITVKHLTMIIQKLRVLCLIKQRVICKHIVCEKPLIKNVG